MASPTVPRHPRAHKAASGGFETVAEITDRVLARHNLTPQASAATGAFAHARWLLAVFVLALVAAILPLVVPGNHYHQTAPAVTRRHHG